MNTKGFTTSGEWIKQRTPKYGTSGGQIAKTISWYKGRVQELETEQKKLNDHLSEYRSYLDFQSNNTRRLKATIRELRRKYEMSDEYSQWVFIPKSILYKAIILGGVLFLTGLILSF